MDSSYPIRRTVSAGLEMKLQVELGTPSSVASSRFHSKTCTIEPSKVSTQDNRLHLSNVTHFPLPVLRSEISSVGKIAISSQDLEAQLVRSCPITQQHSFKSFVVSKDTVPSRKFMPPETRQTSNTLITAASGISMTPLREFMRDDRYPRRQRKYFLSLHRREETSSTGLIRPIVFKPKRKEKKLEYESMNTMSRLSNLLGRKRPKKRSINALLHMLRISIIEERQDVALELLEQLPSSVIKRKRHDEVNFLFLLAISKRMEPTCIRLYEKGYPPDVNAPIFVAQYAQGRSPKFIHPSFFLVTLGFRLYLLSMAMIKKANPNLSWYGVNPLMLVCSGGDNCQMSLPLVSQLLALGANPTVGIPLEQYQIYKKMQNQYSFIGFIPSSIAANAFPISSTRNLTSPSFFNRDANGKSDDSLIDASFGPCACDLINPENLHEFVNDSAARFHRNTNGGGLHVESLCPQAQGDLISNTLPKYIVATVRNEFSAQNAASSCVQWSRSKYVYPLDVAACSEQLEIVSILLRVLDASHIRASGLCLLGQHNFHLSAMLITSGANINQRDWGNLTPLHLAARLGRLELVFLYLVMQADPNSQGQNNWTPLHEAVSQRHCAVSRMLVRYGANPCLSSYQDGESVHGLALKMQFSARELHQYFDSQPTEEERTLELKLIEQIKSCKVMCETSRDAPNMDTASDIIPVSHLPTDWARGVMKIRNRCESVPSTLTNIRMDTGINLKSDLLNKSTNEATSNTVANEKKKKRSTFNKFMFLKHSMFMVSSTTQMNGRSVQLNASGQPKILRVPSAAEQCVLPESRTLDRPFTHKDA